MIKSRCHRGLFSEVPREIEDPDAGISRAKLLQDRKRTVTAAIINVDRFPLKIEPFHHAGKTAVKFRDPSFFIKGRNYHREECGSIWYHMSCIVVDFHRPCGMSSVRGGRRDCTLCQNTNVSNTLDCRRAVNALTNAARPATLFVGTTGSSARRSCQNTALKTAP